MTLYQVIQCCNIVTSYLQGTKKRKADAGGVVVLTRPLFVSRKETRRLTLKAPEAMSIGGKAAEKILKHDDGCDDNADTQHGKSGPTNLVDNSIVGKDATHLLN